ncbi:MAG: glycosyltransferase family 4 protein, partial [Planctomycetota bacterium]|jgi:starch synthase (maltosyl-transferring)
VAVSESEAETIASSGVVDPARLRTVPNGIDPARVEGAAPADLAALGLDPGLPVAAVVGLLYSAKGQDLALEALAEEGLEGLQLLFVGPGDREPLVALAERLGVARRVAFTGPRDDVPSLLAAADMLLLPSRWEGMPYVVLEAMAASRAVVATPVDGARDLVEDDVTGFLAASISAPALAAALRRAVLAGASRRGTLGAAGRARLEGAFDVDTMAARLDAVYREALEASGSR